MKSKYTLNKVKDKLELEINISDDLNANNNRKVASNDLAHMFLCLVNEIKDLKQQLKHNKP